MHAEYIVAPILSKLTKRYNILDALFFGSEHNGLEVSFKFQEGEAAEFFITANFFILVFFNYRSNE